MFTLEFLCRLHGLLSLVSLDELHPSACVIPDGGDEMLMGERHSNLKLCIHA